MNKTMKKMAIFASVATLVTYSGYNLTSNISEPTVCEVEQSDIYMIDENAINIVAHRGLSGIKVENSFDAVDLAFQDQAVGTVEIDIQLTKDNEIVLLHDSSVDSLTNGHGKVKDLNLDYIKSLNYFSRRLNDYKKFLTKLGVENEKALRENGLMTEIATLDEILTIDTDKTLLVDIKFDDSNANRLIAELTKKISEYDGNMNFIFQSTEGKYLKVLRSFLPNYEYQIIVSSKAGFEDNFNDFDHFAVKHSAVSEDLVKNIYSRGKTLSVWTITEKRQYDKIYEITSEYSDNITYISDFPDCVSYWMGIDKRQYKNTTIKQCLIRTKER